MKVKKHKIQLFERQYEVLVPEYDFRELYICEIDKNSGVIYGNKDILKSTIRHDTLFLTSSKLVFKHIIYDCFDLAENGEELFHRIKGVYDHKHLDCYMSYKDKYHKCIDVTLDYYDKVLWQHIPQVKIRTTYAEK